MQRESFHNQLRRSFVKHVVTILVVILLLALCGFMANYFLVVVKGCENENHELRQQLEYQLEAYYAGLDRLAESETIREAVTGDGGAHFETNEILYGFANEQSIKSYFILLDKNMNVVSSNFTYDNQKLFARSVFLGSAVMRMNHTPTATLSYVCTAPVSAEQACSYSLCRPVLDEAGAPVGYLIFNLREKEIRGVMQGTSSDVIFTDEYKNLIFSTRVLWEDPHDKQLGNRFFIDIKKFGITTLEGGKYYAVVSSVGRENLRLYTLHSLDLHLKMLMAGAVLFGVLMILLAGIVVAMTRAFAKHNAMELKELRNAVAGLTPDGDCAELPHQCSAESQLLYTQFRELVLRNEELLDCRRKMEIKHLEEQFNPHFVFNVMEAVRYQIGENPEIASQMLQSFASLMRYSVNYGQTKVPLETDVEYVNDYLLLQKARYDNFLSYEFHVGMELLECRIPKLLLQPIIENSIKHGYQSGRPLHIRVDVMQRAGSLVFVVADNGAGITAEGLAFIRRRLQEDMGEKYIDHVGLYNIQKVIHLTYGPDYGIEIESEPGRGTTVTITIPCETEEDEAC